MVSPRRAGVSVLIPQWGNTDFTERAVAAVNRSNYEGTIEILVYDNASPGGPGPVADRSDVRIIEGSTNIGFGPALNILAEVAQGDFIVILNNDTVVDPRCIGFLVDRMDRSDRPGAVAPQYRSFSGETLEMGSYVGRDASGWQLFRGTKPPRSMERLSYRAHYSSAACLMFDRRLFLDLGGFDDLYAPAYYEDTDLCLAMAHVGRPTVVEPRSIAFHYEGGTAGTDTSVGYKAYQLRNQARFFDRWQEWLSALPDISFSASMTHALAPERDGLRILWATPHLPRPDREAGHARMMEMIRAVREKGHTIAVWARHCHDAGRYGPLLEDRGIPWFGPDQDSRPRLPRLPRAINSLPELLDAVWWDAVVISFAELAADIIPVVRRRRPHTAVIVDDVDLHFLREQRGEELGVSEANADAKQAELDAYRSGDGTITASDVETSILRQEIPGLPIHTFAVAAEEPRADAGEPTRSLLFLGNFHHQPNIDAVDWWAKEIAPEVARLADTSLRLRIVGSGSESYADAWPDEYVDIAGWVEDLDTEFRQARVFLAPLRYGAGTKGKIATALAHGVPTVTTSIGAEGAPGDVLAALSVADDASSIAKTVVELMTDDAAWSDGHQASRAAASRNWRRQQALAAEFVDWIERRARLQR